MYRIDSHAKAHPFSWRGNDTLQRVVPDSGYDIRGTIIDVVKLILARLSLTTVKI